jgi:predicted metal-dependent RNase
VPAFAIGRTQALMYHLDGLEKARRIPRLPIWLDSPMAIEATGIYCEHPEEFDGEMQALTRGNFRRGLQTVAAVHVSNDRDVAPCPTPPNCARLSRGGPWCSVGVDLRPFGLHH